MTPQEKAIEVYNKMDWFTVGYIGSSMLTNTEFDDQKIKNTKAASMVVIDEILDILENKLDFKMLKSMEFWQEVKNEINKL